MPKSAPRALQQYRARRRFDRTREPSGAPRRRAREERLEFVVQRHHARKLHYDFRLEWAGVLKSWAVPRGPSLDPGEKRLAVQVEDHPYEYRTFSGEIPEGEYGAGRVLIWDRGHWTPEGDVPAGLRDGKLDFRLHGERLRGRWSLVRLRDEAGGRVNWLLIKRRDEHALGRAGAPDVTELYPEAVSGPEPGSRRREPARTRSRPTARRAAARRGAVAAQPAFIAPQLATAVDAPPGEGHWLTELKFDGYRMLAHVDGTAVRCFTRNGLDWTHRLPGIVAVLEKTALRDSWLDGELIAVDDRGLPQFQRLQQALDRTGSESPRLVIFDALRLFGADLRDRPQAERKRMLQQALAGLPRGALVRLADFVDGESAAVREQACARGFEGVILKDAEARYRSGRNRAWLKLKCRREQEFVIGGYTRTDAGRATLTALLLGYYDEAGQLQFAGRAGTGFSAAQLDGLRRRLDALAVRSSPFGTAALRRNERPRWVEPKLVAQVRFAGWTESGLLRQPLFIGLREDVAAAQVRREPDAVITDPTPANPTAPVEARRRKAPARGAPPPVQLTHPERVLFPADGVTKRQLAAYYETIAPVLWPHLRNRPLSLVRATSAAGRVFFQRHVEGDSMPALAPVDISSSDAEPYFVCRSQASIPLLAQLGAVELHTWGSRMPRPERADRITFDLDPDPLLPWAEVRQAATLVRDMLGELGLVARLKTSGGLGLHLVVPLVRGPPMEVVAAFSRRLAEHLARVIPQRFSARRGAANRKGKIYVDWQRNQFAATTVAAYSPRHRPGVPVSLPIDWDELGRRDLRAAHFNLRNVAARIAERGDAWDDAPPLRQALTQRVIDRLEAAA